MLNLLKLIHIFLGLNTLAAGAAVCARMMNGKTLEAWLKHFLRFSLASASVGLILSIKHASGMQLLTMLTVYVSGVVVFSWRKYGASDAWCPVVVLSTMSLLCMQTVIISSHVMRFLEFSRFLDARESQAQMIALDIAAVVLFTAFSMISLKRIHRRPKTFMLHGVAR